MRILPLSQQITSELRKVENAKKTDKAAHAGPAKTDKSDISANARRLSDTKANSDIISAQVTGQPEIREDKVAEVRKKIEDGYYNSPEFIDKLADKLIRDFGVGQG
jgi:negative regulator of flagellin synthesis FlgM